MSQRTVCGCGKAYDVGTTHICNITTAMNVCGLCGEHWQGAHVCSTKGGYLEFDPVKPTLLISNRDNEILAELRAIRELLEKIWSDFPEHGFK